MKTSELAETVAARVADQVMADLDVWAWVRDAVLYGRTGLDAEVIADVAECYGIELEEELK